MRLIALSIHVRAGVAALALSVIAAPGCVRHEAARLDRLENAATFRLPADSWPARLTDNLDQIVRDTPTQIIALEADGTVPEGEISPELREARRPLARITFNQRFGQGIIRTIRRWRKPPITRFISYSPLAERLTDPRIAQYVEGTRKWFEQYLKQNGPGLKPADKGTFALMYEGTQIRVNVPEDRKPIGLVVHMAGLGSLEYEQPVLDELIKRGWAVLRIATPSVWWQEAAPVRIGSDADIQPTARRLARTIDDLVAEPAYAAEAALEYLAATRPSIPQTPLIMLGCSAGALAAPAVVARMPDKFTAVVLVGAGANLLKLSQTSDLTDGGIRIMWPDEEGNASQRRRLYDGYLKFSRLDPYHCAATMADKPVLIVQASFDSTVPASGGELLWERLGRPERWNFTGGHRLLFWKLSEQAVPLADWIDHAAAARVAPVPLPELSQGSAGAPAAP